MHQIAVPPLPTGYDRVENPFGVLTNIPLVWLALAVPLAWRNRSGQARSVLRYFVMVVGLLFGTSVLTLLFYGCATIRYELDFLPALVLLAVIGILSLERALAPTPESGLAGWPGRRRVARWNWGLLLGLSVAFNLLASVGYYAYVYNDPGNALFFNGRVQGAIRLQERALRLNPDYADAHNSLASELFALGKVQEGSQHFERSLEIRPNWAPTHYDWGIALAGCGKLEDAIGQDQEALRINPNYPDAHNNLGIALMRQGRLAEAIGHYEQALRIKPDYVQAQCNLGNALLRAGNAPEAIGHYEQALRIKPDLALAQTNLARARALK